MNIVSVVLYLVASFGLGSLALKYLVGPAPTPYHAKILKKAGIAPDQAIVRITGALNQGLGAALLALAVLMAALTVFGVSQGRFWASAALLVGGLIVGGLGTRVAYELERQTGVRTPWRPAAALTVMTVVAFILSAF